MIDCALFVIDKTFGDVPNFDISLSAVNRAAEIIGEYPDGSVVIVRRDAEMVDLIGCSIR